MAIDFALKTLRLIDQLLQRARLILEVPDCLVVVRPHRPGREDNRINSVVNSTVVFFVDRRA
jgi:hypothetical protein